MAKEYDIRTDIASTKTTLHKSYEEFVKSYLGFDKALVLLSNDKYDVTSYRNTLENIKSTMDNKINTCPLSGTYIVINDVNTLMDLKSTTNLLDRQVTAMSTFSTSLTNIGAK